jgi:hypothetical protein
MSDKVMNEVLTIARKAGMKIEEVIVNDDNMPTLPLGMPLEEYVDKIREHAIKVADGNLAKADRLLGQKVGVMKQWKYHQRKRNLNK